MNIEDRLNNWGRVVRDPRWQPQCCASWARVATALRDAAERQAEIPLLPRDIEDGWRVERAWQRIQDPLAKRLLQYHYVHRMEAEMVCRVLVRKYGAAPNTLRHWETRLAKAQRVMMHVLSLEDARRQLARQVARQSAQQAAVPSAQPAPHWPSSPLAPPARRVLTVRGEPCAMA